LKSGGEFGVPVGGGNQPGEEIDLLRVHNARQVIELASKPMERAGVAIRVGHRPTQRGHDQVTFGGPPPVDRPQPDLCPLGDILHPEPIEPGVFEEFNCRTEDALIAPSVEGTTAPTPSIHAGLILLAGLVRS
jgi:hypothetical protein